MKEFLELVKQTTGKYVDLYVFDEGEIYYIIDVVKHRSAIAVCLSVKEYEAIFKIMDCLTGDWFFITDHDRFIVDGKNLPLAENLRILPVRFNYKINLRDMKLKIASEVDMYMLEGGKKNDNRIL